MKFLVEYRQLLAPGQFSFCLWLNTVGDETFLPESSARALRRKVKCLSNRSKNQNSSKIFLKLFRLWLFPHKYLQCIKKLADGKRWWTSSFKLENWKCVQYSSEFRSKKPPWFSPEQVSNSTMAFSLLMNRLRGVLKESWNWHPLHSFITYLLNEHRKIIFIFLPLGQGGNNTSVFHISFRSFYEKQRNTAQVLWLCKVLMQM